MENSLRKYKFMGASRSTTSNSEVAGAVGESSTTAKELNDEILISLKTDMVVLFKSELKSLLAEELGGIKPVLHVMTMEFLNNMPTVHSDLQAMITTVSEMARGLFGQHDLVAK